MPRFAFLIEYDGSPFCGWQRQPNVPSVQQTVEIALRKLEPDFETLSAAGRTDTGVHATGQVAHADLHQNWDAFRLGEALNFHLKPAPVAILECAPVAPDWHARFSAEKRYYTYRVLARRARPTLEAGKIWGVRHSVDIDAMRAGAAHLIGTHDFTTFRSTICQAKSPVKTMESIDIDHHAVAGGTEIRFHLTARSFLHNQVRSIVGSLMKVGAGSWDPDRIRRALEAHDRAACGPVAPPDGLYLTRVDYPDGPFHQ